MISCAMCGARNTELHKIIQSPSFWLCLKHVIEYQRGCAYCEVPHMGNPLSLRHDVGRKVFVCREHETYTKPIKPGDTGSPGAAQKELFP